MPAPPWHARQAADAMLVLGAMAQQLHYAAAYLCPEHLGDTLAQPLELLPLRLGVRCIELPPRQLLSLGRLAAQERGEYDRQKARAASRMVLMTSPLASKGGWWRHWRWRWGAEGGGGGTRWWRGGGIVAVEEVDGGAVAVVVRVASRKKSILATWLEQELRRDRTGKLVRVPGPGVVRAFYAAKVVPGICPH